MSTKHILSKVKNSLSKNVLKGIKGGKGEGQGKPGLGFEVGDSKIKKIDNT